MSEPQVEPNGQARGGDPPGNGSSAPSPPPAPAIQSAAPAPAEGFLHPGDPTDDSPTIVSRSPRRPADRPEDGFAANLRGRSLAHFSLIEPIGVGGMAAVIRATDMQLDRTVALKILPPEMAADPENIRRFQQKARAAAKLDHENIARVFFFGEDQGLHFIAFEFVEGENLRTLLERRGRIPLPEAISYMLQVATGLAHAAGRGVVHRDIKPSNIIISPNGRAKLVDMGLARSLEPQSDGGLTQSGVTLGTFDYISPEQALEPRDADVRSDIYSMGCTFYHVLTGHAPVPEGTAARKLHHHQHVPPIDPRQLNPDIPDEVAAILARMMAKDAKARYQRPEHLVQHLIMVAQKLGTGAEVPDGVLFVDAPLPAPPRAHPLPLAIVAAVVLVSLIVVLGSMSGPSAGPRMDNSVAFSQPDIPPLKDRAIPPRIELPPKGNADVRPAPAPIEAERLIAHNEKELADLLKRKSVRVAVSDSISLTRREGARDVPGLVFQGTELTLEPENPATDRRPTIRLAYDQSGADDRTLWPALTLKSGRVIIRGLRFEVDAADSDIAMAAVALRGAEQCTFENCEFVQTGLAAKPDQRRQVSVLVTGSQRQRVFFNKCYFKSGKDAVALNGPASIQSTNCAFGPHSALFHLQGPSDLPDHSIGLSSCSALLESGAVFRLEDGASCRITASHCLFARPETTPPRSGSAVLIRQQGERAGDLTFAEPHRNGYHNLRAFLIKDFPQETQITALRNFQQEMPVKDSASIELVDSPWKNEQPLGLLESNDPLQAFQASDRLAELRQVTNRDRMIGVEQCAWGQLYPDKLPAPEAVVVRTNRIVDPTVPQDEWGIFRNLSRALDGARSGDVIRIRHTGLLSLSQIRLNESTEKPITIKPASGHTPILTLDRQERDVNAALFRLHDANLNLEDLQFRLRPRRAEPETQAVVTMVGVGRCLFKRCVATLERTDKVRMALVALDDPSEAMKMAGAPPHKCPRIMLDRCFVRGAGDLVAVRVSRQFEFDARQSLVCLSGPFLVVDGNARDPRLEAADITLDGVTAYHNDHLVLLRACKDEGKGKGLAQVQFKASACLFATDSNKSLVHLEGVNDDKQMKDCLSWLPDHNAYSGFSPMLDQQPRTGEPAVTPYDEAKWKTMTREEGLFTRIKFAAPPSAERPLVNARPSDFEVKGPAEWEEFGKPGARIESLPKPAADSD